MTFPIPSTYGKSWRTTASGIGAIFGGFAMIGAVIFYPVTLPVAAIVAIVGAGGGLISTGIGLFNAKDVNVHTAPDGKNITVEK